MEFSGRASAEEAEATVRKMLNEAFERRDLTLDKVVLKSCEHTVEKVGCTVAAVVLW
jgi:arginine decarboxylase